MTDPLDLACPSDTNAFMCNLYSATMPVEAVRHLFAFSPDLDRLGNSEPLPAIYPKYRASIVTIEDGDRFLTRARWGFLKPNKSKKTGKWLKLQAWNNTRDARFDPLGYGRRALNTAAA